MTSFWPDNDVTITSCVQWERYPLIMISSFKKSDFPIGSPIPELTVNCHFHNNDVIIRAMASQIISLTIAYLTVYSGADQRKHQSSASLAFVRGIHRWPVNSPHKWPVTRKMFPFDDVIASNGAQDPMRRWDVHTAVRRNHKLNTLRPRQNGRHFPDDIFESPQRLYTARAEWTFSG